MRSLFKCLTLGLCSALLLSCGSSSDSSTIFELIIENTSSTNSLIAQNGTPVPVFYSSAVGAIHTGETPVLYRNGVPAGTLGLEELAEDGDPGVLAESLTMTDGVSLVFLGSVPIQEGASASLLAPGQSYSILLNAESSQSRISFALSFLQGNDIFAATPEGGIPLFDETGNPVNADITSSMVLLDAGTESNEAPGLGQNQVIQQMMPGDGAQESGVVGPIADGFSYPSAPATLSVRIAPITVLD